MVSGLLRYVLLIVAAFMSMPSDAVAGQENPYGVAVIIGNKDYRNGDIPAVEFAHNDAVAIKRWVIQALGFDERNVIMATDAAQGDLFSLFANERDFKGRLWQLMRRNGRSDVVVYFSGHGMPGTADGEPFLLPADADPARPHINGYPLALLYANLEKLDARSVMELLDACFSGGTAVAGCTLITAGSPVLRERPVAPSAKLSVLTAAGAKQIASWDMGAQHGLFTRHFLDAVSGKVPAQSGQVTLRAVKAYLTRR